LKKKVKTGKITVKKFRKIIRRIRKTCGISRRTYVKKIRILRKKFVKKKISIRAYKKILKVLKVHRAPIKRISKKHYIIIRRKLEKKLISKKITRTQWTKSIRVIKRKVIISRKSYTTRVNRWRK